VIATPGLKDRRQALRMLSNGLYVITSRDGARCGAATVTWVSQASFQPPLLMTAVRPESNVFACLVRSGRAAVHVLARGQEDLARRFFAPTLCGDGTLNGEPYTLGTLETPILATPPAYLECRVRRIADDLGDHALVVLEVIASLCRKQAEPLTLAETPWRYGG
jgi:flavin reductase (DIM6/NTAB) family NADH-FMN oxidoreductase RutF